MRFSNAAALFSLASLAQAAPAVHSHKHAHQRDVGYGSGAKYQSGIFYINWAIYARQHFVTDLPADKLTKINYGFANVNNQTGEVFLTDEWADIQYGYPGDVATNGTQLLGNFKQLFKLKQQNRNLKVILSVGGWGYRDNFKPALATEAGRQKFCDSALTLIKDLGIDGLDLDWEYPEDETDGANLVDTLQRCRRTFDEYAVVNAAGYHFDLGVSAPAGPSRYTVMPIAEMDPYVDNWNLMAFDYQGPGFSNFTGHLSNVYPSSKNPKTTDGWDVVIGDFVPFNTKEAIDYYKANVASPSKIQLGMPLYGRSFANVVDLSKDQRGLGQKFNGSGDGTWEPGTLDYRALPQNGSKVYHDKETLTSWSWDKARKQMVSFDTPKVASWKTDYLMQEGLGGAWWWESSGDFPVTDDKSIIATVINKLGGEANFRQSWNNLYYPKSKYYNIRSAVNSTISLTF
ncbi:chitinase [Alternaria panax]|uniref:chitinase n=1 Tax=Alternaria panax TaxID=48097 RepID=A0AAD4IAI2_9PLEO|nr:chitinase [Alternaria panax]